MLIPNKIEVGKKQIYQDVFLFHSFFLVNEKFDESKDKHGHSTTNRTADTS